MASAYSYLNLPLDDTGDGKVVNRYFERFQDIQEPTGFSDYKPSNQQQSNSTGFGGPTTGNYSLTIGLRSGESFTTASLPLASSESTIKSAIDSAATSAGIVGWTNGDIEVFGNFQNFVTMNFTGSSVSSQNHPLVKINNIDMNGDLRDFSTDYVGHPYMPTLQIVAQSGFLNVPSNHIENPSYWSRNTLVPKPEKSIWEFVASTVSQNELQVPSSYEVIMGLGGFIKPALPTSPISDAL